MKMQPLIAWSLCPLCLVAGLAVRVMADDDSAAIEKYRALRAQAEVEKQKKEDEIAKRNTAKMKEMEVHLAQVRKWTNVQFELGERNIIDKPKAMSNLMKRWQAQHKREIYQLLQFPEKSDIAIESGRALNVLMERIGPAACENSAIRKIKPDLVLPLCNSDYTRVDRALAEEITWQDNIAGAKLVGQGSRGLLDLDWPAVLREERWKGYCQRYDDAKNKALAELSSSSGLSSKSDAELREAIASLNVEFANYRAEWIRSEHPNVDRALEIRRIFEGTRHIRKLVMGVYQLAERTRYQTVDREPFQGGTIEDYMAYFQRHNLRFAPANPANRSAYHRVFTMMVRYYLDQKIAVNLEQQLDRELSMLKRTDKEAIDAALERTMSASDQAPIWIREPKSINELLK